VLSPGIPIDHPLAIAFKRNKKAVIGETELAARYIKNPVVAVTGTNGKTTTVSMITETLCKGGIYAKACGNIGTPMIEMRDMDETGVAVAEISSFQMETLNSLCPHIAVILNVTEDHLNRHYSMENYQFLKGKLLKNSSEAEYAVLNYDDLTVREFGEKTKAQTIYFSVRERVNGAYLQDEILYFKGEPVMRADELFTGGIHNIQNALACICVAKVMGIPIFLKYLMILMVQELLFCRVVVRLFFLTIRIMALSLLQMVRCKVIIMCLSHLRVNVTDFHMLRKFLCPIGKSEVVLC
jgi:UDP-N-acetylmuramoylalanine--D-glutamate ligase